MRRLSISIFLLTTLASCGDTTSSVGEAEGGDTTSTTSEDTSVESDAGVEARADTSDEGADVDEVLGCTSDEACDTEHPCTVATCELASGDCVEAAAEDGSACTLDGAEGQCSEGVCVTETCGDGTCQEGEDNASCPADCPKAGCDDDELYGCDGETCVPLSSLGDGVCDEALNCEAGLWDEGDCDGCGDGVCDEGEGSELCPQDCCPVGEVKDCEMVSCVSESGIGDGVCDTLLDCEAYAYDGGDCEPVAGCGDGLCDASEDASTCPEDCASTTCNVGEIVGCDGETCVDATWLGDGACNPELNCEETLFDAGDCAEVQPGCGDGLCDASEDVSTCPSDCGDSCEDGVCDPGEGGADIASAGLACIKSCDDDAACAVACLAESLNLTMGCAECFGDTLLCVQAQCLDLCESEGPTSDACESCLEEEGCVDNALESCLMSTCAEEDIAILGGSCNQDCDEDTPSACGDGFCQPDEEAADPLEFAALCLMGCGGGEESCAESCLLDESGLSEACAGCSLSHMSCVFDNCYEDCFSQNNPNQELCAACAVEAGCSNDDYAQCQAEFCTLDDSLALASSCPEDCGGDTCLPGQVLNCEGMCMSGATLGDGQCDEAFNCEALGADGGDCAAPTCGDQQCSEGEAESCPSDCATCDDDQLADCSGGCSPTESYGDGECDIHFNCEPLAYDGGDCLAECGDGLCAAGEGPTDMGPIASTCAAECDNQLACTRDCISAEGLSASCAGCFASSSICVAELCATECFDQDDEEACISCASACYDEDLSTCINDSCSGEGDSETLNGSCAFDCGECGEGLVTDCEGECTPAMWLGDGQCQPELSCEALKQDMGDCVGTCGNGLCDEGEGGLEVMGFVFACSSLCGTEMTCLTECVIEQTQVSFECASCHTGFFDCMVSECLVPCDGSDEEGCSACLEEAGCMTSVMACDATACASEEDSLIIIGACPGDCLDCAPGQVKDCTQSCSPEEWVGDGDCDQALNCPGLGFDGGDCVCDEDEIQGCQGGCVKSDWIGNAYCDANLDCEEFGYDAGDCDVCGNSFCGPNENNATCPEDCTEVVCESGKIENCEGLCVNDEEESSLGDGECNPSFACETWAWDGGDCCPSGEAKDCYDNCADVAWVGDGVCQTNFGCVAWDFDDGDCIGCGDGECGLGETEANCPEDCAPPTCGEAEVLGCDWQCYPASWYGDGTCDEQFQCEDAAWDDDDCCPTGFIKGCDGACGWEAYLGDGGCDPAFDCLEMEQDKGDCGTCGDEVCNDYNENPTLCQEDCGSTGCGEGYLDDCFGGCTPAVALGDGTCDAAFSCTAWNFDEEDCCPDDQKPTCDGGCSAASVYGDGLCDVEFNCQELNFDGGDCSACAEGEILTCEGFCFPDWLLGTGDCDQELNCEALGWDGGDCLSGYCGDGSCDEGETLSNCATDCEVDCGAASVSGCFGGCVSVTLLSNDSCDDALACPFHNWDNNTCGYCGDFVCDPDQENASICPQDCGDSVCLSNEVDGCEAESCVPGESLGDGTCTPALNCKAWDYDGGDCCEDPEMIKVCGDLCAHPAWKYDGSCDPGLNCEAGDWDGGDCDVCGDEICGSAENSWSCPEDCTEVVCAAGQIESCTGVCVEDDGAFGDGLCDAAFACAALDWDDGDCCAGDELSGCDGSCVWEGQLSDGVCDPALDCMMHDNDGGDCCGEGYVQNCAGECVENMLLSNGTCDEALNCVATDYDGGDCCPEGFLKDCSGGCTASEVFGDDICDAPFACDALEWDKGACCPAGSTLNCEGGCSEASFAGDGICQDVMSCSVTGWDGGDCCPDNELPICNQAQGDGLYCTSSDSLGDGFCDPDFNCDTYNYDAGDCVQCGNGICEVGEDEFNCMLDCGASPGEACYPDEGGVGTVDCTGFCYMGMTSEACDEAFNCPEANWDWGDCLADLPKLVLNEIDMKSGANEDREFIEIYNPNDEPVSLSNYGLDIYSLTDQGVNYAYVSLEDTFAYVDNDFVTITELGPDELLVICQSDVFSLIPPGIPSLDLYVDSESNDEGAIVLTLNGGVIDSVAYSMDSEVAIHAEGSPVEVDSVEGSLNRCPDGADSDDNASDFIDAAPSPGSPNTCAP